MPEASRHISVVIDRPLNEVYRYASNPSNLSQWAAGLAKTPVEKVGNEWVADSPMGQVKVDFAETNQFGVLDHVVTLPTGQAVTNPVRVISDGDNESEVIFTLRKRAEMSDKEFEDDTNAVVADLTKLKQVLESQ